MINKDDVINLILEMIESIESSFPRADCERAKVECLRSLIEDIKYMEPKSTAPFGGDVYD